MSASTSLQTYHAASGLLPTLLRAFRVWQRNRDAFLRIWKTETGGIVAEPFLVLLAVGFGLGAYVDAIQGRPYTEFIAPGLLASYAMFGAVFETTYGTYIRMETRRVFAGILATPIAVDELVLGEIMWASTRSLIHAAVLLLIAALFGLVHSPWALLALPAAVLIGLMFSSIAMLTTSLVPSINTLNSFFTLFITPMFFFSGVFYPLEGLPSFIQRIAWALPLTPATKLMRTLAFGEPGRDTLIALAIIAALTLIFLPLSIKGMRRRLIK